MNRINPRVFAVPAALVAVLHATPVVALDAPHNAIQCEDCHTQHAASYPKQLQQLCQSCHFPGGPATARVSHSSKTTDPSYGNWDTDCWACHDPHTQQQNNAYGTPYGKFLRKTLKAQIKEINPADPGPYYTPVSILRTVSSTNVQDTSATGFVDGDAISSDDLCRVCHVSTKATGFAGGVYTTAANAHYNYNAASQPGGQCTTCHPHDAGFRVSGCVSCHNVAQPAAGTYRRPITGASGDFVKATHHVTDGTLTQIVTDRDCAVCHSTDTHRSNPAPSGVGVVLKNPDVLAGTITHDGKGASVETFCVTCHDADGATAHDGTKPFSDGRVAPDVTYKWSGAAHQSTVKVQMSAEKCLACHGGPDPTDPAASFDRNMHGASGPSLLSAKIAGVTAANYEEAACLVCHDGVIAAKNIKGEFAKTYKHPAASFTGRHQASEDAVSTPAAYAYDPVTDKRHSECVDCHNPHAATAAQDLLAVSRLTVTNGLAGTAPSYTFLPETDIVTPFVEYQLCFKCHSSWTTLRPDTLFAGVPKYLDKGVELNPANESTHPVEGPGKNVSSQMAAGLAGGTGLPHLLTSSVLACSDCHNNDQIPTNVSTLGNYAGLPKGPHGSTAAAGYSPYLLRASYQTTGYGFNTAYSATRFTFCYICHSPTPFADTSGNNRSDTVFRFHGFHLGKITGQGSAGTNPNDPSVKGSNGGNAICKECHYQLHSNKLAYWAGTRSYQRLVSFSPSISGPNGTGAPVWNHGARSCTLRCHGMDHTPETY